MQNYKLFNILSLLLISIFVLTACRKDLPVLQPEHHAQEVSVQLQLQYSMKGIGSNKTKAAEYLDGQPDENKITSLTIFIINLKPDSSLNWDSVKYATHYVQLTGENAEDITFNINTNTGKKHIYIGANMTMHQIVSFCANKGVYTSSGTTYTQTIGDFVDLSGRGIVMFGQAVMNDGSDNPIINITGLEDESNPLDTKLELSRVVSKVALTYEPNASDSEFVILANGTGSIKAENIYFMLNNTAKSIDFIKGMDIDYSRYSMKDYLAYNSLNTFNPLLYYYKSNPISDFILYTPSEFLPGVNTSNAYYTAKMQLPIDIVAGNENPYLKGLDEYIPPTANSGKHTHYNSSLYCLENTVSTADFTPADSILDVRHGINTKVIVVAKYTPGIVLHYESGVILTPKTGLSESQMDAITNNDPNGDGTFYAVLKSSNPNTYEFYTYDAKEFINSNPPSEGLPQFITYKGGYGYYATFISQPTTNIEDDDNYNLYRNHYYILSVKEFTPPGAVYPQDVYMMVNSETTDWLPGKSTTVIVE